MAKALNDLLLREGEIALLLSTYRVAKVPDGILTDERRHAIVMSLKEERDELWLQIKELSDQEPEK